MIWPSKNNELRSSKWYYIRFVLVLSFSSVNLIGSVLHLMMISLPNESFYHVAEDLIVIVAQFGVYYYMTMYVASQHIAAKVFSKLSEFRSFGKPPQFDGHTAKLQYLAKIYRWGLNSVVISYFLEPILTRRMCERENKARNFEDICGLVSSTWMPFNITDFPYKQLFYLWQTFSMGWTYLTSGTISFQIVGITENVLIRVWHLKSLLKEAVETKNNEERRRKLSKCLDYHCDIYEIGSYVDKMLQKTLFVHVLFSGALFGIMGFSVLTVGLSIKTMSLFAVWVGAAVFASIGAQRLLDGSLSVAEAVYYSNWYDGDYRFQKDLLIIMQRAIKPIVVHAGPFVQLSNPFILAIFKTAYTYLTLLKVTSN